MIRVPMLLLVFAFLVVQRHHLYCVAMNGNGDPDGGWRMQGLHGVVGAGRSGAASAIDKDVEEGQIIVKLKSDSALPRRLDALRKKTVGENLGLNIAVVKKPYGISAQAMIDGIKSLSEVEYTELDVPLRANDAAVPNDASYAAQYGPKMISAPLAWKYATGSRDPDTAPLVCVIDTGIDYNHPDLVDNIDPELRKGYNAITGEYDAMDDNGHGTHCAGVIAASSNNSIGMAGLNWKARLVGCKFMNDMGVGTASDAIECINWCVSKGAMVLSNSWSGGYVASIEEAIRSSRDAGSLFVAAAGNDGQGGPEYPAALQLDNIISVAATDSDDNLAYFLRDDNVTADIAAPGVNIYSTMLGETYGYLSGTSMAAPHVSGVAAFLMAASGGRISAYPEAKDIIYNSVDKIASFDGKIAAGGRLNMLKAVQSLPDLGQQEAPLASTELPRRGPHERNASADLEGHEHTHIKDFIVFYPEVVLHSLVAMSAGTSCNVLGQRGRSSLEMSFCEAVLETAASTNDPSVTCKSDLLCEDARGIRELEQQQGSMRTRIVIKTGMDVNTGNIRANALRAILKKKRSFLSERIKYIFSGQFQVSTGIFLVNFGNAEQISSRSPDGDCPATPPAGIYQVQPSRQECRENFVGYKHRRNTSCKKSRFVRQRGRWHQNKAVRHNEAFWSISPTSGDQVHIQALGRAEHCASRSYISSNLSKRLSGKLGSAFWKWSIIPIGDDCDTVYLKSNKGLYLGVTSSCTFKKSKKKPRSSSYAFHLHQISTDNS